MIDHNASGLDEARNYRKHCAQKKRASKFWTCKSGKNDKVEPRARRQKSKMNNYLGITLKITRNSIASTFNTFRGRKRELNTGFLVIIQAFVETHSFWGRKVCFQNFPTIPLKLKVPSLWPQCESQHAIIMPTSKKSKLRVLDDLWNNSRARWNLDFSNTLSSQIPTD